MAALDGKITICIDYRPCIVHIPAVINETINGPTIYRKVVEPEKDVKGIFHCWSHRLEVELFGELSSTFAIVEFEDGTVHEIEPWNIRFIDNLTSNYNFEDKNVRNK